MKRTLTSTGTTSPTSTSSRPALPDGHEPAIGWADQAGIRYGAAGSSTATVEVTAGEVFGFLGPNGAGKSTTIRLLLGLARPTAGRAWVFDVDAADVVRAHRLLAYVPADVALWPQLTGAEILHLQACTGPGIDPAYRAELVDRFALDLSKPARTYSTGNRQKVALIAAFATRAPLLVLDEPTSGLDPLMEREFRIAVAAARDRGQTVFLSSHQLAEVEAVCDRVAILATTRITRGEEDAGRWDVLLAGRVTLSTAVARPVMVVMSGQARRSEAAGGSGPRSAPAETTDKAAPTAATGWCYGWSSFWRTASGTARPGDNFRRAVGVCLVHGGSWDPNDKLFSSGPTGLVTVSGV